jgi:hypothetical protein
LLSCSLALLLSCSLALLLSCSLALLLSWSHANLLPLSLFFLSKKIKKTQFLMCSCKIIKESYQSKKLNKLGNGTGGKSCSKDFANK